MIYDAVRVGIAAGFKCLGFLLVAVAVYCIIAALVCFSDWVVERSLPDFDDEEDDDAPMDD